jgi:hypothetical protein
VACPARVLEAWRRVERGHGRRRREGKEEGRRRQEEACKCAGGKSLISQGSLNLHGWMTPLEDPCAARKLPALPLASLGRLCLHDFRSKRYQVGSRGC